MEGKESSVESIFMVPDKISEGSFFFFFFERCRNVDIFLIPFMIFFKLPSPTKPITIF